MINTITPLQIVELITNHGMKAFVIDWDTFYDEAVIEYGKLKFQYRGGYDFILSYLHTSAKEPIHLTDRGHFKIQPDDTDYAVEMALYKPVNLNNNRK